MIGSGRKAAAAPVSWQGGWEKRWIPECSADDNASSTTKRYEIGDELFLLLRLMDEPERLPVAGKVVWVTPPGAEGNRAVGVGVQFSDQDKGAARRKIEDYLAGMLASDRPMHTM